MGPYTPISYVMNVLIIGYNGCMGQKVIRESYCYHLTFCPTHHCCAQGTVCAVCSPWEQSRTVASYTPRGASCLLPFYTNTFWTIGLCLPVCLTVHQSVSRALHLSALSVNSLSVCSSICLFIHLSNRLLLSPSICPFSFIYVLPPICVCLSICLSVHLSDHPNPSIHLSVWSAMRCITYSHSWL